MISVDGLFHFGIDVLKTTIDSVTKSVIAQLGDVVQEVTAGDRAEWWQHVGFLSRPSDPEKSKQAAQAIAIRRRDRDVAIASRDLRGQELAGTLGPGETTVYAAGADGTSQGRMIIKDDGSVNLYTRAGNTSSGQGMLIQLDAANDAIRLVNSQGYGIIIDTDGIRLTTGSSGAGVTIGSDGIFKAIATDAAQIDGTSVTLGSSGILGVNSALRGPSGMAGVASAKVIIE